MTLIAKDCGRPHFGVLDHPWFITQNLLKTWIIAETIMPKPTRQASATTTRSYFQIHCLAGSTETTKESMWVLCLTVAARPCDCTENSKIKTGDVIWIS